MQTRPPLTERLKRFALAPSTDIIVAILLHYVALRLCLRTVASSSFLFEALEFGLATVLILRFVRRNKTQFEQQVQDVLAHTVDEHERQLAVSQAAFVRENEERTYAEEKLLLVNTVDPLTGLLKRGTFLAKLDNKRTNSQELIAVFFVDLDHFKVINDGLGDAIADRVLIAIGDRIARLASGDSLVGRVGGDEYALSCTVTDRLAADKFGELILTNLTQPVAIDGQRIHIKASIGLRLSSRIDEPASLLLRDAHTAMHRAKYMGRAQLIAFDAAMRNEVETRYALTSDLHQAVTGRQFFVEYQPIYDLIHGRVVAYEGLARWNHPDRGRVEPGIFIPAAEDNGLVTAIGEHVLHDACQQIVQRGLTAATPIGINLSARQLAQPHFCETIREILATYKFDPHCLLFEVTESTIVESLDLAREILQQFKAMGLRLAIDDFGTGYSSLSYLRTLPFDVLKIDRSFVRHIDIEENSRDIVRMIVTLAESLDMTVVAEGVETAEQLQRLRELGCFRGQGFLFSRPLAPDEAFKVAPLSMATLS